MATETLKILILEDNAADAEMVQRLLRKEKLPCTFRIAMTKDSYVKALDEFRPQVILSDHSIPDFNSTKNFSSLDALNIVQQRGLNIPFILVTGNGSVEFAAQMIKAGADDYILKDNLNGLPAAINNAVHERPVKKETLDYKYALDQSSIISVTDHTGRIKSVNANFCKLSQYTEAELLGQDHRMINSGFHTDEYMKELWQTINSGHIWRGELCNKTKSQSIYWVDATIVPFINDAGEPIQYLAIVNDITSKKLPGQKILGQKIRQRKKR